METITKTFNLYSFDELAKEVKEKVIEREAKGIGEMDCEFYLKEYMQERAEELLAKNFGKNATFKNAYFSLGYCQGDGAMIEFDLIYCGKKLEITHNRGLYFHANSFKIVELEQNLTERQYRNLKTKIYNMNLKLEKIGYNFIEEDRTAEAIEQLKDCLFYENGGIY